MVDWCTIRRRRPRRVGAGPFFLGWNNQQLTVRRSRCWVTPHATFPRSSLHRIAPTPFPHTSTTTYSRRQPAAAMSEQGQEEFRVLFAAAEKGRADIINTSVEALKKSGLFSVEEGIYYTHTLCDLYYTAERRINRFPITDRRHI